MVDANILRRVGSHSAIGKRANCLAFARLEGSSYGSSINVNRKVLDFVQDGGLGNVPKNDLDQLGLLDCGEEVPKTAGHHVRFSKWRRPLTGDMTINYYHEYTLARFNPYFLRRMSRVGVSAI